MTIYIYSLKSELIVAACVEVNIHRDVLEGKQSVQNVTVAGSSRD